MINVQPLWTPTSPRNDRRLVDWLDRHLGFNHASEWKGTHSIWDVTAYREAWDCMLWALIFGKVLCSDLGKLGTVMYFIGQHILVGASPSFFVFFCWWAGCMGCLYETQRPLHIMSTHYISCRITSVDSTTDTWGAVIYPACCNYCMTTEMWDRLGQ